MSAEQFIPHQFIPRNSMTMTPEAIEHTRKQLGKSNHALGLRIAVKASGCSGYKYVTSIASQKEEGDQILHITDGVDLYVNQKDLPMLDGMEIDYVTEGLNRHLVFNNPNATGECGCGESFSVS